MRMKSSQKQPPPSLLATKLSFDLFLTSRFYKYFRSSFFRYGFEVSGIKIALINLKSKCLAAAGLLLLGSDSRDRGWIERWASERQCGKTG